jgi:hypothetical protein
MEVRRDLNELNIIIGSECHRGIPMSADLVRYNAAKQALAAAVRVDEVKDIRDKAVAMRVYAMQARDRVLIDQATEIRLRAERRAGELLKDMAANGERAVRKNMKSQPATSKLSDLDINKSQSARWQKLADIKEDDFEELVTSAKQKASNSIDRAQQMEPKPKPAKKDAAEITATCIRKVESIVRAAISEMNIEERAGLFDQVVVAVRTIMNAAANVDADKANGHDNAPPDPGPDEDRWIER